MGFDRESVSAASEGAYWEIMPTRGEWFLLTVAVALVCVLQLNPVLHGGYGHVLLAVLALVCFLSPITGFFFIGSASILPFPQLEANYLVQHGIVPSEQGVSSTAPALIGAVVWFGITWLRYRRFALRGIAGLWPLLPFFVWAVVVGGQLLGAKEYAKSVLYAVMACQLANEARGQYLKCLLGLCLGALMVIIGYWGWQAGLPIELSDYGPVREGFVRLGGVRTDAVATWPPILFGVFGLLGIAVAAGSTVAGGRQPRWLPWATMSLFVVAVPPLFSTMCSGAMIGFGLMLAGLLWLLWGGWRQDVTAFRWMRKAAVLLLLAAASTAGLYLTDAFQMRTKSLSLMASYKATVEERGYAASRNEVWECSLRTISKHPLGLWFDKAQEEDIPAQYMDLGYYLSHNVFLDIGRGLGVPGMLLLAFFFFWPSYRMWRSRQRIRFLPFLLAHFGFLVVWISLSWLHYKTFWALWMLMALVVNRDVSQARQVYGKRHARAKSVKGLERPAMNQPARNRWRTGLVSGRE